MDLAANDLDKILSVIRDQNDREQELAGIPQAEEDKLVDKNIVKSREGSTFRRGVGRILSTLSGNEKRRTYNVAYEMARAYFDFNKTKQKDEKPPTIISESKGKVDAGSDMSAFMALMQKGDKKKKGGAIALLAAAIASIILLADLVYNSFAGLGQWAMKSIFKVPKLIKSFHTGLKAFFKGYAAFVDNLAKWFDEGLKGATTGAKGLAKVAGGLKGVMFRAASFLGGRIAKYLRFIPLFGSLVSFVFAYKAFKEGKWFRGSLEFLSGVLNLPIFGPLGFIASAALDGAMLIYDLLEDTSGQAGAASVATKAVKYGLRLADVLFKVAGKVAPHLLTALKFIPLIGGFAGMALAYMRFKEGDWLAGSLELIAAIADFFPGVGTAISWVLDGALLLYDVLKTPENKEQGVKGTIKSGGLWGVIKRSTASIGKWLVKNIEWIPVFGNLWSIGEGINSLMSGKWGEGTFKIIKGLMIFLPPNVTDLLVSGLDWVVSLFSSKEDKQTKLEGGAVKPFSTRVKEFIDNKMADLPYWIRKPLEWLGILKSSDNSNLTMPKSSMEWAYSISNAFNELGDAVINSLRDFIPGVVDAFKAGLEYIKSGYMQWAHDKSQLSDDDTRDLDRIGRSTAYIGKAEYMKMAGIESESDLPSKVLRQQYEQLKAQKEFTGSLGEYRESVLGDSKKAYDQANATLKQNQKGLDAIAQKRNYQSDPAYKIMVKNAGNATRTMEELQRKALQGNLNTTKKSTKSIEEMQRKALGGNLNVTKNATKSIEEMQRKALGGNLNVTKNATKSIEEMQRKEIEGRIQVNSPQSPQPSESMSMSDTNDLLAQNNELMFQLLGVEQQALLQAKKSKPGVMISGGENKALGGNAVQGSYSSNRAGSKGSYNVSPYSLGASSPHVSM